MDLMFTRYSNPFLLLDTIISQGRLCEFILELDGIVYEEQLYDFWIHKVFDKSLDEFRQSLKKVTEDEIKTVIRDSKSILDGLEVKNDG